MHPEHDERLRKLCQALPPTYSKRILELIELMNLGMYAPVVFSMRLLLELALVDVAKRGSEFEPGRDRSTFERAKVAVLQEHPDLKRHDQSLTYVQRSANAVVHARENEQSPKQVADNTMGAFITCLEALSGWLRGGSEPADGPSTWPFTVPGARGSDPASLQTSMLAAAEALPRVVDETTIDIQLLAREEDQHFFFDWTRSFLFAQPPPTPLHMEAAVVPSIWRSEDEDVVHKASWPYGRGDASVRAWPLTFPQQLARVDAWLEHARVEVSADHEVADMVQEMEEIAEVTSGNRKICYNALRLRGPVAFRDGGLLQVSFRNMWHPVAAPRMLLLADGGIRRRFEIRVSTRGTNWACAILPLANPDLVHWRPLSHTPHSAGVEMRPRNGMMLMPNDGFLVTFYEDGGR